MFFHFSVSRSFTNGFVIFMTDVTASLMWMVCRALEGI